MGKMGCEWHFVAHDARNWNPGLFRWLTCRATAAPCQRKPLCMAKNRDREDHRPGWVDADLPERCPMLSSRRPRRRLGETPPAVFPRPGRRMLFTIGTFGQRGPISLTRGGPCRYGPHTQARARPGPACDPGPMCGPSRRATW